MIARNESHILERCLDAALPAIDAVSICDTGSTDDTVARARRWLRRQRIPGRVYRHVWRNFGHNRTRSLVGARRTVSALGWDLASTYLLFLDADMVLEVGDGFVRDALVEDVYDIVQRNGALAYPNVRLARASLAARYVGATHEYFASPDGASHGVLAALTIDDRNDGGSRADKFVRDVRLLEEELRRDPANVRAMFYLAQSYRALEDFPRSLFWYRRRIAAGGWREEVWYSLYSLGMMYERTGERAQAVRAFHAALRYDPQRAEPWFRLANLYRGCGRPDRATFYARRGLAAEPSEPRKLFVETDSCDVGLLRELAIAGYYTRHRAEAARANETLALRRGVPPHVSRMAADNSVFFAAPLKVGAAHLLRPALPAAYVPCNPSILRTADGYVVNVRAVSYRIDAYQRYSPTEPDGVLRTRNYLLRVDRDLGFLGQQEIEHALPALREHWVQGLEDCRLVWGPRGMAATCTTTQYHPAGPVRISWLEIGEDRVERHIPLGGHGDHKVQKNWLPFEANGELRAVYGFEPLVVLAIDPVAGRVEPVIERRQGRNFHQWRGSAGPVDLPATEGGGKLLMVHEVAWQGRRYYLHRFVHVDGDWNIDRVSEPFYFRQPGIEFACGMCLGHGDRDLLVTYGVEDREAYLARIPLSDVMRSLRPLPD